MPKYTVEIHRTVTVTPQRSGVWGWLIFAFLVGCGIAAFSDNPSGKPPPEFHNPLRDIDNPFGNAPDDDPPSLTPNPYDQIPDTAKPEPIENRTRRLVIPGNSYHQCYVEGQATAVKTAPFRYLIDTGAWTVAFSRRGAEAMGLDAGKLVYDQTISTANGAGKAANIRLRELRVGEFVFKDVAAQVNDKGMDSPLLGATVLKKFLRLEYVQGNCILTLADDESGARQRRQEAQRAMRELSTPAYKPGDRRDMNRLIENAR
jgi:clan AA aspartic protease (TIGR02281 family)